MPESPAHALAVVSTSLHVLYLAEFAHRHGITSLELVILLKRSTDRAQIEQVLDEIDCDAVHWVDATSRLANRFISVYEVFGVGDLKLARERYTFGVFADYGRSLLANVDCERYYWLGDGTKIISRPPRPVPPVSTATACSPTPTRSCACCRASASC